MRPGPLTQVGIAGAELAAVVWLINLGPARGGFAETYIAQPLLWLALAVLILVLSRWGDHRLRFRGRLQGMALLCGGFHLGLLLLAGMLAGFGKSPLAHTPPSTLQNLTWVFSALLGVELTRAYLLSALAARRIGLTLGIATLVFTFVGTPFARLTSIEGASDGFAFLGKTALPLLSENLLASYLALLGGPLPAIAYRSTLAAFEWLSPVLPNLSWALAAFVGTVAPAIGLLAVRSVYGSAGGTAVPRVRSKTGQSAPVVWIALSIFAVGLSWFSLGLFPMYPTVAVGDSMSPTLEHGDLAILRNLSSDTIEAGDVIHYIGTDRYVLHRVVEAGGTGPNRVFTTKGDGNNVEDPSPVPARAVRGRLVARVPHLGYAVIGVKEAAARFSGAIASLGWRGIILLAGSAAVLLLARARLIRRNSMNGKAEFVRLRRVPQQPVPFEGPGSASDGKPPTVPREVRPLLAPPYVFRPHRLRPLAPDRARWTRIPRIVASRRGRG